VTRTERLPLYLESESKIANTNGPPIHVGGNALEFQVTVVTANIVGFQGTTDKLNWAYLHYDNTAGAYSLALMAFLGIGYYKVHERPKWVRMIVGPDAGHPQDYNAILLVKKESD
jgi:hypothetical protein